MKEIRAYIRRDEANQVVEELRVSDGVEAVRIRDRARGDTALIEHRPRDERDPTHAVA